MPNLSVFNYQSQDVRTIIDENQEAWFIANDICTILGYKNPSKTISDHCKPKGITKRYTPINGINQEVITINEPNLYRLVIKSKKAAAVLFEEWVFEEVLPSIRKTGSYTLTINAEQQQTIKDLINRVAAETGLKHAALYPRLHNKFKVPRYQEIPASRFDEVVGYLKAKLPAQQMFYGLRDGRYLLHVEGGKTNLRNIEHLVLVDNSFIPTLRKNFATLSQQLRMLSGETSSNVLDIRLEALPEVLKLNMRESFIEKQVTMYAKAQGWISYKWSSPNQRGVPDRLFFKDGGVLLVEFKATGKQPTNLQEYIHKKLEDKGVAVHVIDSIEAGKQLFTR